jgi:glucose/arabinose dehydrogenase
MSSHGIRTNILRRSVGWLLLAFLLASPVTVFAQGKTPTDTISLTRVAAGLNRPVFVTAAPGDRSRIFVVEKPGRIRIVTVQSGVYTLLPTPFLNISSLVSTGNEQGLLSLAFHPSYASNGYFFVYYTNTSGNIVVARYSVSAADPNLANPASAFVVFTQSHPVNTNHNGGQLQFGPDGYLYLGLGDGGGGGDQPDNAQNTGILLGKMLRIDVNGGSPYAIPPTNPFVGPGNPLDEIWAIGVRNPWRFSFDRLRGDLWIGDVGQGAWEEVDLELANGPGGKNWGWRCKEGTHVYDTSGNCPSNLSVLDDPIYEYPHNPDGCAITGGYVYRGSPNSSYFGRYVFADYCNPSNQLWMLAPSGGGGWVRTGYTIVPPAGLTLSLPSSFGQDAIGDLYVTDDSSSNGEVFKINLRPTTCVAANYDVNGDGSVTVLDILLVAGDWYRTDYIPDLDVNCDAVVDIVDVQLVAAALAGAE